MKGLTAKAQRSRGIAGTKYGLGKSELAQTRHYDQNHSREKNILEGLMKKKVSTLDITIFTRQLATMMKAGVPLVQGFEIVAEGLENPSMREVVLGIKGEVEGEYFCRSLTKIPTIFR